MSDNFPTHPLTPLKTLSQEHFTATIYRGRDPDVLSDAEYVWVDLTRNHPCVLDFSYLQLEQVDALICLLQAARRRMKPLQAALDAEIVEACKAYPRA